MLQFKILLVDDSPNILKSLQRTFRPEGYTLLTAESAREALVILEKEDVDVIISDENMPGIPGTELLRLVKERYPDIVRIMLTGIADIEVAKKAINDGEIYRFFNKPWDDFELVLSVKYALQRKVVERENNQLTTVVKTQQETLRQLEEQHPGITEMNLAEDGSIIIDT
ncbi:MAG: response regulator [candidate division Zixibacteria bacterium]|nr:response regulator [candidate division Zixibacteria bacterium]